MRRKSMFVVLAVLALSCGTVLLLAATATAGVVHRYEREINGSGTPTGSFLPLGLAFDDSKSGSAGDLYVADFANGVVDKFNSRGIYQSQLSGPPGAAFVRPRGVAVDQSTGEVFVADEGASVVDKLSSAGVYLCQITAGTTPSTTECAGVRGSATPDGSFTEPTGVAVDHATGDLYVADTGHHVVDRFDSAGEYLSQLTSTPEHSFSVVHGVTVDNTCHFAGLGGVACESVDPSNGDVYIADNGFGAVYKFDSSGAYQSELTFPRASALQQIAVDQSTGDLYVADKEDRVVQEFNASGALLSQIDESTAPSRGGPFEPYSVAIDSSTGDVYVGDAGNGVVDVFGPGIELPEALTGPFSKLSSTSVTLEGEVNPKGSDTSSAFQSGPCAKAVCSSSDPYGATQPTVQAPNGPSPGSAGDGSGVTNVPVEASLAGLVPNQAYHYRLVAQSAVGPGAPGVEREFTTPAVPAQGETLSPSFVGFEVAALRASLNPEHSATSYRFEYGPCQTAAECAGTTYVSQTKSLQSSVYEPIEAFQEIETQPATEYHYRLVAENTMGTTLGANVTFTTESAPQLIVSTGPANSMTQTSAVITGSLDPNGVASSFGFQLGTQAGVYGPEIGIGRVGAGTLEAKAVMLALQGLEPGVTYHYRLIAADPYSGTVYGADQAFTTVGASSPIAQPLTPSLIAIPPIAFPIEPRPVKLTRAQRLARALSACAKKPKRKRRACRRAARKTYGPVHASSSSRAPLRASRPSGA